MSKKYHKYNVTLTELQLIFNKTTILNLRMGVNSTLKYECGKFLSSRSRHGTTSDGTPVSNIRLSLSKTSYVLTFASTYSFDTWKQKLDQVVDMCRRDPDKHNGHHFEYYSFPIDKEAVFCSVCGFVLKGLVWQGHICILCKSTVHPQCRSLSEKCMGAGRGGDTNQVPTPSSPPSVSAEREESEAASKRILAARSMTFGIADNVDKKYAHRSNSFAISKMTAAGGGSAPSSTDVIGQLVENVKRQVNSEESWFIGMASKGVTKANLSLFSHHRGTFLLRLSDREPGYRLAVVDSNAQVKHIQVMEAENRFCLEEETWFDTLAELVRFYSATNLSAVFTHSFIDVHLSQSIGEASAAAIRSQSRLSRGGDDDSSASWGGGEGTVFASAVLLRPLSAPSAHNPNQFTSLGQGQMVFVLNQFQLSPETRRSYLCQLQVETPTSISDLFVVPETDIRFVTFMPEFL